MNNYDDLERLRKQLSNFASYKFQRIRKELTFDRLDIITRTGFV